MNKDRPKVFHLITRLIKGGAEDETISVMEGLKDKHQFYLGYGAEFDREQVERVENMGIKTRRFSFLRHYNPFPQLLSLYRIFRYIKINDFALVHTHESEAGIIGRLAANWAGVQVIVHTVHGTPFGDSRHPVLNKFLILAERLVAPYTDKIITNSEVLSRDFLELGIGGENQHKTIHSGIDVQKFSKASPVNLKVPECDFKVLVASRLEKGKGMEDFIEAAKIVGSYPVDLSFIVAGEGWIESKLQEIVKESGLESDFFFLGYRKDIERVMKAVDLFVMPSHKEGTPRVIYEAMASGLPIVATDVGGLSGQIEDGENGLLVRYKYPRELAEAIMKIIQDRPLREDMRVNNRDMAKKYSADIMVKEYDYLYQELLNGSV